MLTHVQLLRFAAPDEECGVGPPPALDLGPHHRDSGSAGQLAELQHLLFDGAQTLAFDIQRHQVGTLPGAVSVSDQIASWPIIAAPRSGSAASIRGSIHCTPFSARNHVNCRRAY